MQTTGRLSADASRNVTTAQSTYLNVDVTMFERRRHSADWSRRLSSVRSSPQARQTVVQVAAAARERSLETGCCSAAWPEYDVLSADGNAEAPRSIAESLLVFGLTQHSLQRDREKQTNKWSERRPQAARIFTGESKRVSSAQSFAAFQSSRCCVSAL
jgi:hypothetical protein